MERDRRKVELLAPAGSVESMKAAVAAGADAVYMGGSRFGARAFAENPDEEEMLKTIDYLHLHGRKLYMTVNTLLRDEELEELYDFLRPFCREGLDAVLVQDMGVLSFIREHFPTLPIHASTQMTVTGPGFADLLRSYGVTRVVPARELSLPEIRDLVNTGLEVECFIHGALCFCYSGQCLFSSLIGGRSGNRGRCAQPCRMLFSVSGQGIAKDRSRPLSMKDLSSLDVLPELLDAGAASLKIEGRMKSPRYTAGVVSIYRKYVDRYLACGGKNWKVDPEDRRRLLDLFDRGGQTDGYLERHNGPEMIVFDGKPKFRVENREYTEEIRSRYLDAEVQEKVSGHFTAKAGGPMTLSLTCRREPDFADVMITAKTPENFRVEKSLNHPATQEDIRKQLMKTGGTPFALTDLSIDADEGIFLPVKALNELRRAAVAMLEEKILAAGRRDDDRAPEKGGTTGTKGGIQEEDAGKPEQEVFRKPLLSVLLENPSLFELVLDSGHADRILLDTAEYGAETWKSCADLGHAKKTPVYLALPRIWRTEAERYFRKNRETLLKAGFDGFLVRTGEELAFTGNLIREVKNAEYLPQVILDSSLYTMNRLAEAMWRKLAQDAGIPDGILTVTAPLELNSRQLQRKGISGSELMVYGRIPVMVTAQCFRKNEDHCTKEPCWITIRDRMGMDFPIRNQCRFCTNVIYNTAPLSLLGEEQEIRNLAPASFRLAFTDETPEAAVRILAAFAESAEKTAQLHPAPVRQGKARTKGRDKAKDQGNDGHQNLFFADPETVRTVLFDGEFTRGHFHRGVD